jgi:hypothetical protein
LDRPGSAQRPGSGFYSLCSGCHMRMLCLFDPESKGRLVGNGRSVRRTGQIALGLLGGDITC